MNNNDHCNRQGQCQGNASQYEAYMLGSSFGVGRSAPSAGGGSSNNNFQSVRDCMTWPGHTTGVGNAAKLGGMGGGGFGEWNYGQGQFQEPQASFNVSLQQPNISLQDNRNFQYQNQQQPSKASSGDSGNSRRASRQSSQAQAFVSLPGNGDGQARPMNIPCKIGPIGTNPQSLIQPMEPVTLKVTAPMSSMDKNGVRGPMTFRINPEELFRGSQ